MVVGDWGNRLRHVPTGTMCVEGMSDVVRPSLEGTAVICYGPRGQRGIRDALLCVCFSVTTPLAHSARARLKGGFSSVASNRLVWRKTKTSTES